MGMTFQTFDLLKKNIDEFGELGDVLTLGKLGNQIDKKKLKLLRLENDAAFSRKYCDSILKDYFGANLVHSIDNSNFEGANIIFDMNEELKNITKQYDTIIDIGTSEHVFNVNQSLKNISKLCKSGGRIIHCLPANNQCGHGFWQFSPELFFSLYDESNGYQSTRLNLIDSYDDKTYWQINKKPKNERLELNSFTPLYIFVSTTKKLENVIQKAQQSDYEYVWNKKIKSIEFDIIKKSSLSTLWKRIKDKTKSFFRKNYLSNKIFLRYENKRLFLKNFYKKNKNLIELTYSIK
jgi:SAM-dependent methyltransferase